MSRRIPYLHKSGRFRMRVPAALVATEGREEVYESLDGLTTAQKAVRCRQLGAQWHAHFLIEKARLGLAAQPPAPKPQITTRAPATAEAVGAIAKASARELLARDESIRIAGRSGDAWDWWRDALQELDGDLSRALSQVDMQGLWHDFKKALTAHGLAFPDDTTEERRALVHRWAMEHSKALQGIHSRDDGLPVETPPPVPVTIETKPNPGHRMRDALDGWRTSARRGERTSQTFGRHVETFEQIMGDPLLSTLRRADSVRFRDALQQWAVDNLKTAATADNMLTSIKALSNIARDREWLEGNPFQRLKVTKGGKDSAGREPWTREEVVTLFDAPLFKSYTLPTVTKAGADAAYWVPLLAAYTGARPSELCQLWCDDLSEGAGGLVVEFRVNAERKQKLKKGKVSWRAVPIHDELVRLGLREYWQATMAAHGAGAAAGAAGDGAGPLFPAVPRGGSGAGASDQFGQWFGDFKRSRGFASSTKSLHSFRHTVETELGFAGVSGTLVDAITGHAGQGTGRATYGATIRREAERLRPTVALLA